MINPTRILFIHGSESNSQTYKAQVLRTRFPEIIIPDFSGPLNVRMAQLANIIKDESGWTLIGSSLGGLMAALFATQHPGQVRRLVLLAPALNLPEFAHRLPKPVKVPTVLVIGMKDDVIPGETVRRLAKRIFPKLTYLSVDDDHRLHHTADTLDWQGLLD
ncbi:MAG: alpha/beta hydrolase [Chloroflexi bacterium]|nr:alpha/beta hydrolase [Chloroflexota bacterium]